MSKLLLQQFAKLDSEQIEMYWLAGLTHNESDAWFIRSVARDMLSDRFYMQLLPIGMWPLLTLGMVFAKGNLLSMPARGMMSKATISDMSLHNEITSSDIPTDLYSFKGYECGVQRLFRYSTDQGEILIPTMELIRYLFLHNRTLANALMRPGDLNRLFRPELPDYRSEQELQFTADMPKHCLSNQFAQEFTWLALDPDARHAWDSVYLQSQGEEYATFTPPPLKNSEWTFRGVRHGNCWLVLELLHLTGKCHPCDKLYYGHPSLKRVVYDSTGNNENPDAGEDHNNDDGNTVPPKERIIYGYQLDDGQAGSKSDSSQQVTDMHNKQTEFDRDIPIKKLRINLDAYLRQEVIDPKTGEISFKGRLKGDGSKLLEKELVKHGAKWWPVKILIGDFDSVGGSSQWRLVIDPLARSEFVMPEDGIPFSAVLTISDQGKAAPIFNEMRLQLQNAGATVSDIRTALRLRVR